jgi:hypothetical protein
MSTPTMREAGTMEPAEATIEGLPEWPVVLEMLGPRVARVLESVRLNPSGPDTVPAPIHVSDIVRLSHDPGEDDVAPVVTEIIYKAGPRRVSRIECHTHEQMYQVNAVAAAVGARVKSVPTEPNRGRLWLWLLHAEEIDFPAVVEAAGLTSARPDPRPQPCHLRKIPFFDGEQEARMIALAVVLGMEVLYVTHDPNEVVLFHGDATDVRAVAEAADVTRNREGVEIGFRFTRPRPGAVPGPEGESGTWGNPGGGGAGAEDQDDSNTSANDGPIRPRARSPPRAD